MKKILIAGCSQEISSFNPIKCEYDFFDITRGNEIYEFHKGKNSYIGGAINEIENSNNIDPIYTFNAEGYASGVLNHSSFLKISNELFDSVKRFANQLDGIYLSLHGAMSTQEELDPEGYILCEIRKIVGEEIPITISLDLHGILTKKMLKNCNGVSSLLTYPHVDFAEAGKGAIKILKKIIFDSVKPVAARIRIPALVRGKELITENGLFGNQT
ncbi:MAG: M81 family metallopeptidase, partial [Chloroflexota bacterium]|nr:M81 family metallopeptidase [Chloroflexota bacterium]